MADIRTIKRLLDNMRSEDIAGALGDASWAVSGSKEERIDRVLDAIFADDIHFSVLLEYAFKDDLSTMCEELDLYKSGTRLVLIGRITEWFDKEFGHRVVNSQVSGQKKKKPEQQKHGSSTKASHREDGSVHALVIGNQSYYRDPLANPRKDADDFAQLMSDLGHDTHVHFDLTLKKMRDAVLQTAQSLSPERGLLFYYAGHGAEGNDDNWLIPIDCRSADDDSLERQSVSLRKVLRAFNAARFRVTILDACRSNPFRGLQRGDGEQGLRAFHPPHETPEGDLICYATAPRTTASDGRRGKNGVFTAALLKHFATGGASIGDIMIQVRRDVKKVTSNKQIPWDHSSLTAHWFPNR